MLSRPQPTYEPKRDAFYLFEGLYTRAVCRILPQLSRAGITPNQVTLANIANAGLIVFCLFRGYAVAASLLIQLYLVLDIVDGNLARYANLSSRLGQILDQVSDRVFYTFGFLVLGYCVGNHLGWLLAYALVINLYAISTSKYIVPRLKALPRVRRWGVKKWFLQRKILFGMDLSTQDVIASVLLLTLWPQLILPLVTSLYTIDLIYRLWELKRNERLAA